MTNHENGRCPAKIAAALFDIQSKIQKLGHDQNNDFQKYGFVSVDKYYDYIRPMLVDAGILIIPTEVESSLSGSGKTLKTVFDFHIMHKDGDVWDFPIQRTVYIPFTGAQSCGSALSYADKFIFRTLFKISTGEDGVDIEPIEVENTDPDFLPSANFDYSGPPYRVFDDKGRAKREFSDSRTWRGVVQKAGTPVSDLNILEVHRIWKDIADDLELTDNAKKKWADGFAELGIELKMEWPNENQKG